VTAELDHRRTAPGEQEQCKQQRNTPVTIPPATITPTHRRRATACASWLWDRWVDVTDWLIRGLARVSRRCPRPRTAALDCRFAVGESYSWMKS
jgi:hypothetical protein